MASVVVHAKCTTLTHQYQKLADIHLSRENTLGRILLNVQRILHVLLQLSTATNIPKGLPRLLYVAVQEIRLHCVFAVSCNLINLCFLIDARNYIPNPLYYINLWMIFLIQACMNGGFAIVFDCSRVSSLSHDKPHDIPMKSHQLS